MPKYLFSIRPSFMLVTKSAASRDTTYGNLALDASFNKAACERVLQAIEDAGLEGEIHGDKCVMAPGKGMLLIECSEKLADFIRERPEINKRTSLALHGTTA